MTRTPGRDAPILVAVDFSPDSEEAFAWAISASRAFGAALVVLHVVHDPGEAPGSYARVAEGEFERLEEAATEWMEDFVSRMDEKIGGLDELPAFATRIAVGLPVTRILEAAEAEHAALIVMGGRGRTLADVLLGSKVERVARLSPVPVTVVKSATGGGDGGGGAG